jgi:hypothetical protein
MTLQEKFLPFVDWMDLQDDCTDRNWALRNANGCEKIADEFAIGFALWKEDNAVSDGNGLYYGESRIGVSRENPVDIYELLEIYKEQKQL